LAAIVDDSLAILTIHKYKTGCKRDSWSGKETIQVAGYRQGLFLVNYRAKQKPLTGSILKNDLKSKLFITDYLDSPVSRSILVFDIDNFGFWKMGATSIKLNKHNYLSYMDKGYYAYYAFFPWMYGNVLTKDVFNKWSILDAKTGQVEPFEFAGEYEWLTGCDAVSYIGDKIVCFRDTANDYPLISLELIVNGSVTDTINTLSKYWRPRFSLNGNYIITLENDGKSKLHKIDTKDFKLNKAFEPVWIYDDSLGTRFYRNDTDFIQYSAEDLVGE
jgi:hypothetical protein